MAAWGRPEPVAKAAVQRKGALQIRNPIAGCSVARGNSADRCPCIRAFYAYVGVSPRRAYCRGSSRVFGPPVYGPGDRTRTVKRRLGVQGRSTGVRAFSGRKCRGVWCLHIGPHTPESHGWLSDEPCALTVADRGCLGTLQQGPGRPGPSNSSPPMTGPSRRYGPAERRARVLSTSTSVCWGRSRSAAAAPRSRSGGGFLGLRSQR